MPCSTLPHRSACLATLGLAWLLLAAAPSAATTYSVSCGMGNPITPSFCANHMVSGAAGTYAAPASLHSRFTGGGTGELLEAHATVGAGTVGASAHARHYGQFAAVGQGAAGRGILTLDDVVFSSSGTDPIQVALNVHLSGDFFVDPSRPSSLSSKIDVGLGIGASSFSGSYAAFKDGSANKSGLLAGLADGLGGVSTTLTTGLVTVPVNTPVMIVLDLQATASAGGGGPWPNSGEAKTDFLSTLSFVEGGPVFTLPAGFTGTVDSADGGIVGNLWGAAVPEPATSALVLLALVGLSAVRRAA